MDRRGVPSSVPVALFAYRRYGDLPRTLDCLRAAGVERLYVFSDGPADESVREDVERVRELVAAVEWTTPVVVASEHNLGLSTSIVAGLERVLAEHQAAVVIEDDVCVAPEFYEFACRALSHYEDHPRVSGITGLRYPFDRSALDGYPFDVFLSPRFSSWGWATWRHRWAEFCFDATELGRRISAEAHFEAARAGADMPGMIADALAGRLTGSWDVLCAANMLLLDTYFATPKWNMVENSGLVDGTHPAHTLELAWEPEGRPDIECLEFADVPDERLLAAYRRAFAPATRLARAHLAAVGWLASRRLGRG